MFFPAKATTKVGESVMWYNHARVPEPNTVMFVLNQTQIANLDAPFAANNSIGITSAASGNSTPIMMPSPQNATVMIDVNAGAYLPFTITSTGNAMQMSPNANYTTNGTEQYISSGFMWPKDKAPQRLPSIYGFTVKFEKAWIYDYVCLVHRWMTGQVVGK